METNEEFELEIRLELELTPLSDVYFRQGVQSFE